MGPTHRAAAVAAWLAAAPHLGVHGWQIPAGAAIAAATGGGWLSPDVDIHPIVEHLIPGGHRAWTHTPLLLGLLWAATIPAGRWRWAAAAVAVAWTSHVAADGVFGRVPLWPSGGRWHRVGVGLDTGGTLEHWIAAPALTVACLWLGWGILTHHATTPR